MKIGDLGQHCGECDVIEFCGDAFDYCLCEDERFKEVTTETYKDQTKKIDWSDFQKPTSCIVCKNECTEFCEHDSEQRDHLVRYIADKVEKIISEPEEATK